MKVVTNINLLSNELQNAVIQPLATPPANPAAGQIYTNSADWKVYQYNGTAWNPVGVVYVQDSSAGAVITGLDANGNVTTTNVPGLTLTGYTPVDGGYISVGMTLQQAFAVMDEAIKNAVAGGGEVNQNAWSNVTVPAQSTNDATEVEGQTATGTISAGSKTDTLKVASGDKWVHVKADSDTKQVTIGHGFSGVTGGEYGDAMHVPKIAVDKAGHITGVENTEIVGAKYIKTLTSDAQEQLNAKIPSSEKGQANGVATLDENGLVPSSQLPSYVDDVVEAYALADATALSAGWLSKTNGGTALTPERDKIYVIVGPEDSDYLNQQLRWGGTVYVQCNPSDVNSVNGKTGVVALTQDDIGEGPTYTQYSKTEKEKLGSVQSGATKNTITLNGSASADPSFYAPVDGGTAGQVLTSNGEGQAPTWQAAPENLHKYTITNPVLTASGGAFTWTVEAQSSGPVAPMLVQLYEVATNALVMADISVQSDNSIVIVMNDTAGAQQLTAGSYKMIAIG